MLEQRVIEVERRDNDSPPREADGSFFFHLIWNEDDLEVLGREAKPSHRIFGAALRFGGK